MKKLTAYAKNGRIFTLHTRIGNVAVFEGRAAKSSHVTYETIIIQSHEGREIQGVRFEPAEYPPSNEQWGVKGWTYTRIEQAIEKMNDLATDKNL
jgi:hypothetical protein